MDIFRLIFVVFFQVCFLSHFVSHLVNLRMQKLFQCQLKYISIQNILYLNNIGLQFRVNEWSSVDLIFLAHCYYYGREFSKREIKIPSLNVRK